MESIIIFIAEFLAGRFAFVAFSVIMVAIFVGAMEYSSWSIKVDFKADIWPRIKESPDAVAHWHGERLRAIAFVCGCASLAGAIVTCAIYL